MKTQAALSPVSNTPSDDVIRDYAFHLYEQSGRAPGHDLDNWQEATACLNANIPRHRSHNRIQDFVAALIIGPVTTTLLVAPVSPPSASRKRA